MICVIFALSVCMNALISASLTTYDTKFDTIVAVNKKIYIVCCLLNVFRNSIFYAFSSIYALDILYLLLYSVYSL